MEGKMSTADEEESADTGSSPPHMEPPARDSVPDVTEKAPTSSGSRSKLFNRSSSYLLTEPLWMKAIRLSMIGTLSIIEVAIGLTYIILLSALEVVLLGVYACIFIKRLVFYKLFGSPKVGAVVDQRNGSRPDLRSDSSSSF